MGLSFTIAAGPRQRSHFQFRVQLDSLPHFTVSNSRLPQHGGPGLRICIPQDQGGPVIPPGTGFPFRRLLRLAGLRWRYSTLPPHGMGQVSELDTHYFHFTPLYSTHPVCSLGTDRIANTFRNSSSVESHSYRTDRVENTVFLLLLRVIT
jgi:hypothetical protein